MKHASLFSGIGGFDLAAQWMGWDNVMQCEIDPFCQKVLRHHFPKAKLYEDIRQIKGEKWKGKIDVLTGGFPCQPFSSAGRRRGASDDRFLWPEMLRIIREIQPTWVVAENVRGLLTEGGGVVFERVQSDLEVAGYDCQPILIPACAIDAPHRRERVWFVAHTESGGRPQGCQNSGGVRKGDESKRKIWNGSADCIGSTANSYERGQQRSGLPSIGHIGQEERYAGGGSQKNDTHSSSKRLERHRRECELFKDSEEGQAAGRHWREGWTEAAARLCGMDDGLPRGLDNITISRWRRESLKAYGNAIVPQIAYEIFSAITHGI